MEKMFKVQFPSIHVILFVALLVFSRISFSQNMSEGIDTIPDSVINSTVNSFLKALNSGDREAMQEFIVHSYNIFCCILKHGFLLRNRWTRL
jgi:hypothetical protein